MDNLTIKSLIVVPSVVGSSPIIHPKNLALPARFFYGWMMGLGQLSCPFSMPHPLPPPEGGAAAEAAGAPPAPATIVFLSRKGQKELYYPLISSLSIALQE